ncbi:AGAP006728-PA-like protein [Anopheles sinensis]|uniref:AGAP006728-PA-like protein n=1 Tax=Anopheles sinensis TaxID=74873 RepID=A0A084WLJ4_ANOSI|nr:AGAP006728-PA-like protein [Anopheles sinensis]
MVFIHGGSFKCGSGNSDCYSPEYLLEQNVIVVTMNYRLGPLGLLHLPSQGVEGNMSLKDQLMALRWVAENIASFNGDPNNVTLFGESAGAVAVHLHLLSTLSTQYFHKAICQSGVPLAGFALPNDTIGNSRRLARLINPAAKTDTEVLETLRNAPAKELALLGDRTITKDEIRSGFPIAFRTIPLMLGYNDRDGASFTLHMIKNPDLFRDDLQRLIPRTLNLDNRSPEAAQLAKEIEQFYFGPEGFSPRKVNEFAELITDCNFSVIARIAAELHARFQHRSSLYFYRFEYDGELNLYKKFLPFPVPGAYHADDLGYLFRMRMAPKEVHAKSEAARVRRYMCRMWTNFAKYGNPTPAHDESLPFRWTPVPHVEPESQARFHLPYLRINAEPQMDVDPDRERVGFWEKIYQKYNGGFMNL